jgi:thioredoxin reductase (NADPH)
MTELAVKDVLIIGGGPAGLSALLWCNDLGLSATLLERGSELGGQLLWIHNEIKNYPGRITKNGREMRDHFLSNFNRIKNQVMLNAEVVSFDASTVTATLADGSLVMARYAIIATGLRRRRLGIPGEDEFAGRGILNSGAGQREFAKGKRVAVIGGGDAALENALILSEFAEKIYLIHRRDTFKARESFVDQVRRTSNIKLLLDQTVTAINGDDVVRSIEIKSTPETHTIAIDLVLIRIGYTPNTEILRGQIELNESGYLIVEGSFETTCPNVFAIGDIARAVSPTISTASGSGTAATKAIFSAIADASRSKN